MNLGAQKNFARYAERISEEWKEHPDRFGDDYYKRAIARAIIFKRTEKIISEQRWYAGGYRANIVAYTIALIGYCIGEQRSLSTFLKSGSGRALIHFSTTRLVALAETGSRGFDIPARKDL